MAGRFRFHAQTCKCVYAASPVDQHGTEDQTHRRAGGVRDAQTGSGDRPMIHARYRIQISPGRQADAIARMKDYTAIFKRETGVHVHVSVVTTGTLGWACFSADFESIGAKDAADAKANAHPDWKALGGKQEQEVRAGTCAQLTETFHDEIWRYS